MFFFLATVNAIFKKNRAVLIKRTKQEWTGPLYEHFNTNLPMEIVWESKNREDYKADQPKWTGSLYGQNAHKADHPCRSAL